VTDAWLSPLFLSDIEPRLHAAFEASDLETFLANAYAAGCAAWPRIEVDPARYVRHLAAVLDETDPEIVQTLRSLQVGDLYLACACVYGNSTAISTLERDFIANLEAPLRSTGLDAHGADEVKQRVREFVLVGAHGIPGVANYRGRGQLRSWLRAVALRQAMGEFRGRRPASGGDEVLQAIPAIAENAELAPWKEQYADAFRIAFEQAIAALDERQRNLLRQHHIDRLSIDALATLYRIHRATAARWVAAARSALVAGVRERVVQQLAISGSDLDSALRLVRSQLDVSIHRLLGANAHRTA